MGGAISLLIVVAALHGFPWYFAVVLLFGTIFLTLGRRRIFRAGVTRSDGEIICRFIPWYEGNAYVLNVGLPIIAVASLCAGLTPGNPAWLCVNGVILLILAPLFPFVTIRNWRRCFLRITPSTLTARLPRGDAIEIRRERIAAITPKVIPNGVSGGSLQVEIAYHPIDSSSSEKPATTLLGLQLTVEPDNLAHALVAWNDATNSNPVELLSQIEQILRGY